LHLQADLKARRLMLLLLLVLYAAHLAGLQAHQSPISHVVGLAQNSSPSLALAHHVLLQNALHIESSSAKDMSETGGCVCTG